MEDTTPRRRDGVALYSFTAQSNEEVSFEAGDVIANLVEYGDSGWWYGSVGPNRGLLPSAFVYEPEVVPAAANTDAVVGRFHHRATTTATTTPPAAAAAVATSNGDGDGVDSSSSSTSDSKTLQSATSDQIAAVNAINKLISTCDNEHELKVATAAKYAIQAEITALSVSTASTTTGYLMNANRAVIKTVMRQKRWCQLSSTHLTYYNAPGGRELGKYALDSTTTITSPVDGSPRYSFSVHTSSLLKPRRLLLTASTEADHDRWIKAITTVASANTK